MPRAASSKWRNKKRGTYAIVGVLALVIPFILLSYHVFGQKTHTTTLQLVSIIFRHGDRTPTHLYPNDPYKDSENWPDGFGALTTVGKQQMYKLGKFFRKHYDGFISEIYSPEDIYVVSSDHDRCLMSAQLCLAGLYPPVSHQIWNEDLRWQPIPVHTIPRELDKLLVVKKRCPKLDLEINQTYSNTYFTNINSENGKLYKYLSEHSGMRVSNVLDLETLYNILDIEVKMGFRLPDWAVNVYDDKMRDLAALSLAAFTFTNTTRKLKGGPLLGDVVQHISQKVLGLLKPNRKVYLYSGHDLTLVSVLRALGFQDLFKPEYGASLIFELHQPANGGDHLVQLSYLNNTEQSYTVRLQMPECEDPCKLKDFLRLTKPVLPENWEAECRTVQY